jgi:predicted phage terminase large subunit-like protein
VVALERLTRADLERYATEIAQSLAEERLRNYTRLMWPIIEPGRELIGGWAMDAIDEHLEAVTYGQIRRLLINVPPGFRKPVYNRSMVVERKRGRIELRDVRVGDYVLTHRGRFRRVDAVHEQGVLPLLQITTKRGRVLKLAADHPVLTARGWIQAQHVTTADVLAEVHPGEPCGAPTTTAEEARLLGYLIGDGSVKYGDKSFTNKDPQTLADFIDCARSIGFATHAREVRSGTTKISIKSGDARGDLSSKGALGPIRQWLIKHGLDGRCSYDKRVPPAIMAASNDLIADFLAAYWSCDGTISDRRDLPRSGRQNQTTQVVRVEATTVCEGLARDIQHLLTRLGMSFVVRRKTVQLKTRAQGDLYVSWEVRATDQDTAAKFMDLMRPRMRHEKSLRAQGLVRCGFDSVLNPDAVVEVVSAGAGECRCLTVREDHSFTAEDLAVHNSLETCVFWPSWEWGPMERPDLRYGFIGYRGALTLPNNQKLRRLVESELYRQLWPHVALADDQNTKSFFETTATGSALATSIGGTVMGKRWDRGVLDDPNNTKEVDSDAKLNEARMFVTEVLPTRVNDHATFASVTIMQRTGERDVAGLLLEHGLVDCHLCIPMEWRKGHPYIHYPDRLTAIGWCDPRREEGDLAFPERFPRDAVDQLKKTMMAEGGDYAVASQLDMVPIPRGGGMVQEEWFDRFCDLCEVPEGGETVRSWDPAGSTGKSSPFTASFKQRLVKGTLYVMDVTNERIEAAALEEYVERICNEDDPRTIIDFPQDPGQAGKAQVASLARRFHGRTFVYSTESGAKDVRFMPVAAQVRAKNVVLVRAPWNKPLIKQACSFPRGMFKDMVDAWSRGYIRLVKTRQPVPQGGKHVSL